MTIFEYLQAKYGEKGTRILTAMEARAFGIEFPLQHGWVDKHGATEIKSNVAKDLSARLQAKGQRSRDVAKANYCLAGAAILRGISK